MTEAPAKVPFSFSDVFAELEEAFPVSIQEVHYDSTTVIDTRGAIDIAIETYTQAVAAAPELEETISEPEFVLAFGYQIADRVATVRDLRDPACVDEPPALNPLTNPPPLKDYLDGIGTVRCDDLLIIPDLTVPAVADDIGYLPFNKFSSVNVQDPEQSMSGSFPYRLLEQLLVSPNTPVILENGVSYPNPQAALSAYDFPVFKTPHKSLPPPDRSKRRRVKWFTPITWIEDTYYRYLRATDILRVVFPTSAPPDRALTGSLSLSIIANVIPEHKDITYSSVLDVKSSHFYRAFISHYRVKSLSLKKNEQRPLYQCAPRKLLTPPICNIVTGFRSVLIRNYVSKFIRY